MSLRFVIVSLVAHAGVASALLTAPAPSRARREPVPIEVETRRTPSAPLPPAPTPAPPSAPPPRRASPPRLASATPRPAAPPPQPAAEPPARPPAFDTGLQLGNAGGGMDVPTGGGEAPRPQPAPRAQAAPEGCTEPIAKPQVLDRPAAIEYPADLRAGGIEGRLVLQVSVGLDGSVSRVDVVESVDPTLDARAVAAVQTWRFRPASRCGKPIAGGVYTLARRFELGD